MVVGIAHVIMIGVGLIMTVFQVSILILTHVGDNTIETIIGTDTDGTMNGFLPDDFSRTGGDGKIIDTGKGMEPGASRAINLDRHSRDWN
jgi:hypothetical protein